MQCYYTSPNGCCVNFFFKLKPLLVLICLNTGLLSSTVKYSAPYITIKIQSLTSRREEKWKKCALQMQMKKEFGENFRKSWTDQKQNCQPHATANRISYKYSSRGGMTPLAGVASPVSYGALGPSQLLSFQDPMTSACRMTMFIIQKLMYSLNKSLSFVFFPVSIEESFFAFFFLIKILILN